MRTLTFCTTCRHDSENKAGPDGLTGGERLIEEMEQLLAERGRDDVCIQRQQCLWACTQHCNVLMCDTARFSYLAGRFEPSRQAAESILDWFDLHGQSEHGTVPFRQWPQGMRGHFIARMPPVQKA